MIISNRLDPSAILCYTVNMRVPISTKMQLDGVTCTVTGYSSGQGYRVAFSSNAGIWHGWVADPIVEKEYVKALHTTEVDRKGFE